MSERWHVSFLYEFFSCAWKVRTSRSARISEEKQRIAEGMMGHLLPDPIINQQDWEELCLQKWLRFSHCFPRQLKKEREDQRCLAQVRDIIPRNLGFFTACHWKMCRGLWIYRIFGFVGSSFGTASMFLHLRWSLDVFLFFLCWIYRSKDPMVDMVDRSAMFWPCFFLEAMIDTKFLPQKSNIETNNCHFFWELPFPTHHLGYPC